MLVTDKEIATARHWLENLAAIYETEVPTRIHARQHGQHYGLGAAPPFAPEFINFIGRINCDDPRCKTCREDVPVYLESEEYRKQHSDERTRAARAFRKLRRAAPLEFDVLTMARRGMTAHEIATHLNHRAITGGHPERYDVQAIAVLTVLGVDKLSAWY